jgi:hypothetical protein
MRGQRVRTVGVLAVAGLMAGGGSAVAAGSAGATSPGAQLRLARAAKTAPDVTVLFGRAVAKTRATRKPLFAKAVVYEADGSTANGKPTSSARGINTWRFVFDNYASHSRFESATITYASGRFGKVTGIMSPFVEDVQIAKAPKMTLTTAVKRLRGAGYKGSFRFVTLRRPLGPKKINTLYLFTLTNGHNIAVDTVTGKVSNFGG